MLKNFLLYFSLGIWRLYFLWYTIYRWFRSMKELLYLDLVDWNKEVQRYKVSYHDLRMKLFLFKGSWNIFCDSLHRPFQVCRLENCLIWCSSPGGKAEQHYAAVDHVLIWFPFCRSWLGTRWQSVWMRSSISMSLMQSWPCAVLMTSGLLTKVW